MFAGSFLFAANPLNLELLGTGLALIGLLVLGTLLIVWADRWRKRARETPPPSADPLAEYRALLNQGVMSQEEFDKIRDHLENKRRAVPSAPPASDSPPRNGAADKPGV